MKTFFEGWYYKHQQDGKTLAIIAGRSHETAFIQVITNNASFHIPYGLHEYHRSKVLQVGQSTFTRESISLNIQTDALSLTGQLRYHSLTPLKSDIMGVFRFLPMECRHTVVSLHHRITGAVCLQGQHMDFTNGIGYIEGDSGCSFPEYYTWVHSNDFDEPCSVMVSVAKIPFGGRHFEGCIAAVWYRGKEYRLATYHGVSILCHTARCLELLQGDLRLMITLQETEGHMLYAPHQGNMTRRIRESPAVTARFQFFIKNNTLFDYVSHNTSFEHVLAP